MKYLRYATYPVIAAAMGGIVFSVICIFTLDVAPRSGYRRTIAFVESKQLVEIQKADGAVQGYKPRLNIFYDVLGTQMRTTVFVTEEGKFLEKSAADALLASYELKKSYPCWYDPNQPTVAVMEFNRNFVFHWVLGISIVVLFIGIGVLIFAATREKR